MWLIKPTKHWNKISTRYEWMAACREKTATAFFSHTLTRNNLFNNAVKTGLGNNCDHTSSEKQGQHCSRCRSLLGKCLGNESAISPLLPRQITHFHHFLSPPTLLLKRWRQRDQYWPTIYDDDSEMDFCRLSKAANPTNSIIFMSKFLWDQHRVLL